MSGRIVAASSLVAGRWFDRRFTGQRGLDSALADLHRHAKATGKRLFVAIAQPGSDSFLCQTLRADKRGRVRSTRGWPWPNGNRLIASCSVLGVRRQLKRRAVTP